MVDELAAVAPLLVRGGREKQAFLRGMRQKMGDTLARQGVVMQWTSSEIRNVKNLNGVEAVVIVRHQHPNGATLKIRWWVTRRGGDWKVFDMEDLDMSLRISTTVAALQGVGLGQITEMNRAMAAIREAAVALANQQDLDTAEKKLQQIERVQLPRPLEAVRFLLIAVIHLGRGQAKEALEALDRAQAQQPDLPIADQFRGQALNHLGKWEQALKHLEEYRNLLGEDADICHQLGLALHGLGRFPEAARRYRQALDFNPKNDESFLNLIRSLDVADNRDDVGARFAKLDNPAEQFDACAEDCQERQDDDMLDRLASAMRKIDPQCASVDYHLALARARNGRADQAVQLFQTALARQKNQEKRKEYTRAFLQVMASAGQALAAYAAAPDPREGFRLLVAGLMNPSRGADDLERLVAAHGKKTPDDPLLPFYQAEVHVRRERYPLADKTFTAALTGPADEETLHQFRASRVLARYHTGKALSAYREIGPVEETFLQLAQLCWNHQNHTTLETLLAEHARGDPRSIDLARFRARLMIKQNKIPEGVALFRSLWARRLAEDRREQLVREFLEDMVEAGQALEGYRGAPQAQTAFRIVAEELLEQEKPEELGRLVEAHRAGHPDDPWLAFYQGELLIRAKAWERAALVLREGLKTTDKDLRNRLLGQFVFARYQQGKGLQAYAEAEPRNAVFTQLANLMSADRKGADLEALIAAHRRQADGDPILDFYQARARIYQNRPGEAAAFLRAAWQKQPVEGQRKGYLYQLLNDSRDWGSGLAAYRAVPDQVQAFAVLASRLVGQKKEKELAALVEEHGKGHAGDSQYQFYAGELALLRGQAEKADQHFTQALAKSSPQERQQFRHGWLRARVKGGQAARTYQEGEPGTRPFEELAYLCLAAKDGQQLAALLAAHRRSQPDDPNLPAWELEVKWLNRDHEGALGLLNAHRAGVLAQARFRWKADSYLVRCLVRLKRPREAIEEAESLVKNRGDQLLLILAHAASGEVKQTCAAVEKLHPPPHLLRRCYQDEDLGSLLRSEAFRPFRERFPQPPDEKEDDSNDPDD
jgi:predicted Zn-dependent protease